MNLEQLTDQVKTEVVHLSNTSSPESDCFRQQAAVSLLARIPVLLSSAIYSSLLAGGITPRGVDNTLALGAGVCGNHVELAIRLFQSLGVPARDIQVFYRDGDVARNHTVVELQWGDAWRMVDLTWGFIPHLGSVDSALSFEQASRVGHREGLHHTAIPWRRAVEANYDIFGYLRPDPDAIYVDGKGYVRLRTDQESVAISHPEITRAGTWSHIGGSVGTGSIQLEVPGGRWSYTLVGTSTAAGELAANGRTVDLPHGGFRLEAHLRGPKVVVFEFIGETGSGYVELSELRVEPTTMGRSSSELVLVGQ